MSEAQSKTCRCMLSFEPETFDKIHAHRLRESPKTKMATYLADIVAEFCTNGVAHANGNGKPHATTDADALVERVMAELRPLFDRLFKLLELNALFGTVVPRGEHEYADIEAWYSQFIAAKLTNKE